MEPPCPRCSARGTRSYDGGVPRWGTGPNAAQRRAQARIAKALAEVGFVLPGSVATRSYRCGKDNCACHGDPPRLHGPYIQWSHQAKGKTVHANLTPEQLADYQAFFDNAAKLRKLVTELEDLGVSVVQADPRSPHSKQR